MSNQFPTTLSDKTFFVSLKDDSNKLVIFFSAKNLSPYKFNFWQLGQELNSNVIFFNNGRNEWYQQGIPHFGNSYASTVENIKKWREALGCSEIYTIGTSMGGYAAIQYGVELNAKVLAFSTDTKLQAECSHSERDLAKNVSITCPDLLEATGNTPNQILLFAGEGAPNDLWAAQRLLANGNVTARSIRGASHFLPTYLQRRSLLSPLIRKFILNRPIENLTDEGFGLQVDGYVEHLFQAHKHSKNNQWQECFNAATNALKLYPSAEAALFLRARSAYKLENYDLAATDSAMATAFAPYNPDYYFYLAQALKKLNQINQALYILTQLILRWPGYAKAHYAIGIIHIGLNNQGKAKASIKKACNLEPRNKVFQQRLQRLQ